MVFRRYPLEVELEIKVRYTNDHVLCSVLLSTVSFNTCKHGPLPYMRKKKIGSRIIYWLSRVHRMYWFAKQFIEFAQHFMQLYGVIEVGHYQKKPVQVNRLYFAYSSRW